MKVLILAVVVLGLTGCYEVKEVDTVAVTVDTLYVVRSADGYVCRPVRSPVPEKGKPLSCVWMSY